MSREKSERLLLGPLFMTEGGDKVALQVDASWRITRMYSQDQTLPVGLPRQMIRGSHAGAGLIDAHVHLDWMARSLGQLQLAGARSNQTLCDLTKAWAAEHPGQGFLSAFGWDDKLWAEPLDLESLTLPDLGYPVVLKRQDGHAVILNAEAWTHLKTALGECSPESYVKAISSKGLRLLQDLPLTFWEHLEPKKRSEELDAAYLKVLEDFAKAGYVEVHSMALGKRALSVLQGLPKPLPVRVLAYLGEEDESLAYLLGRNEQGPFSLGSGLWVMGLKLFLDGALGSGGAAMKGSGVDKGEGFQRQDFGMLKALVEKDFHLALHAIGDAAVSEALQLLLALRRTADGPWVGRIEHAQCIDLKDLHLFKKAQAVASMQPSHATGDLKWSQGLLGQKLEGSFVWKRLLDSGVRLAMGSDAPMSSVSSDGAFQALAESGTAAWLRDLPFRESQAIGFHEAYRAFTRGNVEASPLPLASRSGLLDEGAEASLSLFTEDPRETGRVLARGSFFLGKEHWGY